LDSCVGRRRLFFLQYGIFAIVLFTRPAVCLCQHAIEGGKYLSQLCTTQNNTPVSVVVDKGKTLLLHLRVRGARSQCVYLYFSLESPRFRRQVCVTLEFLTCFFFGIVSIYESLSFVVVLVLGDDDELGLIEKRELSIFLPAASVERRNASVEKCRSIRELRFRVTISR